MSRTFEISTDGACSGNPGEAAIGVVISENGRVIKKFAKTIGEATNNIAEYTALVYALQEALIMRADKVNVSTDSELMCQQLWGAYKIKDHFLKSLFDQIQHLMKGFKSVEIRHVPREKNREADKLAADVLKKEQARMVAPAVSLCEAKRNKAVGEESPGSIG